MLIEELRNHYGKWATLAKELDFGSTSYQGWVRKGFIPYPTQCIIEKKTKGLFKANEDHAKPQPNLALNGKKSKGY